MTSRREKFADRQYRASYAESFLDAFVATQIKVLREQRGWTQQQLAEAAGMQQSRISALEDANYSRWSVATLKRLARAFDVPLNVNFGTFGALLSTVRGFSREALQRPNFDHDPVFAGGNSIETAATTIAVYLGHIQEARTSLRVLRFCPLEQRRQLPLMEIGSTTAASLLSQQAVAL